MTLSVRLWRVIATLLRNRDEATAATVHAKIVSRARGKRHALIEIPLSVEEDLLVTRLLTDGVDGEDAYVAFCLAHERDHNPHFPPT